MIPFWPKHFQVQMTLFSPGTRSLKYGLRSLAFKLKGARASVHGNKPSVHKVMLKLASCCYGGLHVAWFGGCMHEAELKSTHADIIDHLSKGLIQLCYV